MLWGPHGARFSEYKYFLRALPIAMLMHRTPTARFLTIAKTIGVFGRVSNDSLRNLIQFAITRVRESQAVM